MTKIETTMMDVQHLAFLSPYLHALASLQFVSTMALLFVEMAELKLDSNAMMEILLMAMDAQADVKDNPQLL